MGAAETLAPSKRSAEAVPPKRVVDGGPPPTARRRLARLLWELYEEWEKEQPECATSRDSE